MKPLDLLQQLRVARESLDELVLPVVGCAATGRRRLAGLVLPCQHALRERREHDLANTRPVAEREQRPLPVALDRAVARLAAFGLVVTVPADLKAPLDLLHRPFAETPVDNLALSDQVVHCPDRLLQRRVLVVPVALV